MINSEMGMSQEKYFQEFKNQLRIVCSATIQALIDTHMFMFPNVYKQKNQNTHVYLYTLYAIRQRAILSVRKLIEPQSKDKITIMSIVNMAKKHDFLLLTEKDKNALLADFDTLFNSEHTKRVKVFRDAFCHNIYDKDNAMCYYKDLMFIVEGAIYILKQLYTITFSVTPTFFKEAQNIAEFLSKEYWQAISKAAETANNRNDINIRLDELLSGKF